MADEEAEKDRGPENDVNVIIKELKQRLEELQETAATECKDSPIQASFNYCQDFCRTLLEYADRWQIEEEPLPVVQVYIAALQSFAETSTHLSMECDKVPLVVERLAQSLVELLLSLKELPEDLWNEFRSCVQVSHGKLQENGITQLSMLWTLGQHTGVWSNPLLQGLLSGEEKNTIEIEHFLVAEGPKLLELRLKQLINDLQLEKAAQLAKVCSESPLCDGKANFKQIYLVCLCSSLEQDQLMEELNKVDCRDALEMICNLESDGDDKAAFTLCSAFLTRQLLQADTYCAWELTLFWSKLLKRLEPSEKAFLDKCGQMSLLSKTVYHILFLIKVIQSEITEGGLPTCIEMCIRALRLQSEDGNTKATVCKTIACLLPDDLEVKRACQLTEFLLEPTMEAFNTVETLYNEPDQKIDEEKMPVPNSLRCELLLVFKTQWPFDPEFWDWKTLKRHCRARMGPEASVDSMNESDDSDEEDMYFDDGFLESADRIVSGTYELNDQMDKKQKNREQKKLRDKGFISARFRNWQVYMQYCVLCDKEFLGHRIIRHAQTHFDNGMYSCPICAQSFSSKETLTPHVTSHVKQSCKDRLTAMKTNRKLANPKTAAPVIAAIIAKTETTQKNIQTSAQHPYRPTANTVLQPKVQTKLDGQNQSLWSPASEIKHVQSGSTSQIHCNRPVVASTAPVPLKNRPSSHMGSNLSTIPVKPNPTSITHCGTVPHYTPPSANSALTMCGQSNPSQTGHQRQSPQIQKRPMATAKRSQILPTAMDNSSVPVPAKCPPFNHAESNIAAPIPAAATTSMQMSTKPLVTVKTEREESGNVSSFPMQRDSTDSTAKNTNTEQNPSIQPENLEPPDNNPETCKRKRNKPRWPAIVRDGKWICSRCYRPFSSSKSLGGHLSKRTACKPFDEMELNSDLPASFLDLLNSDPTVNRQQNLPDNPCETVNRRSHSSKSHHSMERKGFTTQKCQEKLNGETSNDMLKKIMAASNMADLFVPPHTSPLHKPCVSPDTSFKSGPIKKSVDGASRDVGSPNIPKYPHSRPSGTRYPTPLLSQALKETKKSELVKASSSLQEINSRVQASLSNRTPPLNHPTSPVTNNIKRTEKSSFEHDIKKKLREQILAGEFQRRSSLANVCHNPETQSSNSSSSESSFKSDDFQMNWDVKGYSANGESSAIIPGTPAEIEELLKTKSFTCLRQNSNSEEDMQSANGISLSQDVDTEPQQLSPSQQQCFSELKIAFEKLNLIREPPEPVPEPVILNVGSDNSNAADLNPDDSVAVPKIFACETDNCVYSTFSSEAFWRHLYKVHNFTFEQVNAVKKQYGQYAPFQCQRCSKTFTRNPNLKAHYISAHQLSCEEINELDMKRRQDRAAMARLINVQSGSGSGSGRKRRLPASIVHQDLLHQKPSYPGSTSVIQALPKANFHNLPLKQPEHARLSAEEHHSKDHPRTPIIPIIPPPHQPQPDVPHPAKGPLTPGKQLNRPTTVKQSSDVSKKTDKKSPSSDSLSQYKPYRCVHQGCEAAFAVQHNLILHYRAVHQSALSALEVNKEQDQNEVEGDMEQEEEEEEPSISEFRCQVKDCSRVFQQVPQLVQHYLRLHEFSIDKFPRQKNGSVRSDDSKSGQSSESEPELAGLNGSEETQFDDSKPFLRKRTSPIIPAALLEGLSNDDSSDGSMVMKRKRGRPKRIAEKMVKRRKMSQQPKSCESRDESSNSSVTLSDKESDQALSLTAFKPMGFEMSFLKFLEQSNKTQPSLSCEIPMVGPWVRLSQLNTKETCVKFSNRQNLKSLDKVKIIMDKAFVGVTEIMLKQLQDMQPMVILDKK
ncbi:hypothetical protein WMY93_016146 [Mugilogobius chulae]|uniref:C2H2-type domain-containing protein n=1 Tax=Mugilogobius chulae TaxID=88201 RepID=A0AAW0NS82_9GOBI